ncbi:hypothetical protein FRC15_007993, partial [Serendipita sp. 397]
MSTDLVQTLPPALRNSIIEWAVALANITKCKYTSVAGLTVVMYDILLLSSDEVRLVWQRPWKNASRFAYLINRYVPPIFLIIANYQLGGFRVVCLIHSFGCAAQSNKRTAASPGSLQHPSFKSSPAHVLPIFLSYGFWLYTELVAPLPLLSTCYLQFPMGY